MVTKSQIKLITSLEQKKNRTRHGLFTVEGIKGISELLNSHFELETLFTVDQKFTAAPSKTVIISQSDLKKLSSLKTPQVAVAVFKIPETRIPEFKGLCLALDGIRDPGNLGTIIRLCDWFGIKELLCSLDTVDCFNPKVVQATMGSITRVNVSYIDLEEIIRSRETLEIFGTFMDGENIYSANNIPAEGILLFGNEANGISPNMEKLVTRKLSIPQFGDAGKTESLNVATAAAIFLSEFRRKTY